MALYREHRRTLEESLTTTVIVKYIKDIKKIIYKIFKQYEGCDQITNLHNFTVKIDCPVSLKESLDPRCGWYSQYVLADIMKKDVFTIQGMLSEPFEENNK